MFIGRKTRTVSLILPQAVGEVVRVIEEPSSPGLKLVVQQALRTIANLACGAGALKSEFLQHNPR